MRVGTSFDMENVQINVKDHPHACGDKLFTAPVTLLIGGSSPCVWGQEQRYLAVAIGARIIPMRVGTSFCMCSMHLKAQDHPHACGDKSWDKIFTAFPIGSSPCVWGQANTDTTKRERMRIIPMRVGTRRARGISYKTGKDHPHACGDKAACLVTFWIYTGSSPCVWGQD